MSLNFAAIDVETANGRRGSICSFGVAVVRDGAIVAKHELLSKPPADLDWFDGFNMALHGITPEAVVDAPTFAERLNEVVGLVGDLPVVAHNAAFDIGAIREGCDFDGLDWPTFTYGCSLVLARRAGLGLLSYRLPLVCDALDIELRRHHRADDDAEAAARIVLALATREGAETLDALAESFMVRLGQLTRTQWAGCFSKYWAHQAERPVANPDADAGHPLYGKSIAFTGGLSILRAEAWALVAQLGATPQDGPTKQTDFLVIGDGFTGESAEEFHTGKALKAVKINAKGGAIEVLTEGDLLELLAEKATSGVKGLESPRGSWRLG